LQIAGLTEFIDPSRIAGVLEMFGSTLYSRGAVAVDIEAASVFEHIADAVRKQQCILFLGAGVHAPPPVGSPFEYPEEQRLPLGSALSEWLASDCNLADRLPKEDPRNLQRVALFYEIERSRTQLVEQIREAVQAGKRPSPMLHALAELDFPLVITTNYDQLFESALATTGKQPRVSVYTPNLEPTVDYRNPTPESPIVFKIHGDITRPETLVVTDEDYIQFVLRMSNKDPYDPLPLTLKFYLTGWTTLFVGYSLLDYNLRLLFKTLRWKVDSANLPDMYSVDYAPDPLILDVWCNQRRYVKFIAQDVWAFVPKLYEFVAGKELAP
jgi:SIR2-like domain